MAQSPNGYVWGPINAEDLVGVPDSDWIITSGMTGPGAPLGRLYAVHVGDASCSEILPYRVTHALDTARFGAQEIPDFAAFAPHGIDIAAHSPGSGRFRSDPILFTVIVLLTAIGVVMVYSSSAIFAQQRFSDSHHFLVRDLVDHFGIAKEAAATFLRLKGAAQLPRTTQGGGVPAITLWALWDQERLMEKSARARVAIYVDHRDRHRPFDPLEL